VARHPGRMDWPRQRTRTDAEKRTRSAQRAIKIREKPRRVLSSHPTSVTLTPQRKCTPSVTRYRTPVRVRLGRHVRRLGPAARSADLARGRHCRVDHAPRSASNADEQGVGKASVVHGRPFWGSAEHAPAPLSGAAARLPAPRRAHAHDVAGRPGGGGGSADAVSGPSMAGGGAEADSCAFIRASSSSTSWPAVRASS
jgi:hypothetical protein